MRNNELKWLHCTGVEIRDSHGAVIGAMETLEDITERTRAEEALRVQTEKFQALSESAPFGMVVIGEDGSFEYVNPKFKEIVGYALADVPNGREWFLKAYPDPEYRREVISAWIGDLNK
jgi:PAS domain-containing protein